jgi:hypothetical protein
LGDEVKKTEMGSVRSPNGERRGACRVLVVKLQGRRPLGKLKRKWEDNIKVNLREVGLGHGLDRFGL